MVFQGTMFSKTRFKKEIQKIKIEVKEYPKRRDNPMRKKKVKKEVITTQDNNFGRQFRIGMRNRRKLGKQSRHYEQS